MDNLSNENWTPESIIESCAKKALSGASSFVGRNIQQSNPICDVSKYIEGIEFNRGRICHAELRQCGSVAGKSPLVVTTPSIPSSALKVTCCVQ